MEPEISESRPEKIHRLQPNLNPQSLNLEASTLPRDHRVRLNNANFGILFESSVIDLFTSIFPPIIDILIFFLKYFLQNVFRDASLVQIIESKIL